MHRQFRRHALAAGLMAGLALLVVGSQSLGASAAPILGARSAGASTTNGSAPWFYRPSGFAGKVLHWSDEGYYANATDVDPSNGKVILADQWMALDAHGMPTAYHVRYTYPDGQLHQEIYQNRNSGVMIQGADYRPPNVPVPPGWCVSTMQTTYANLVGQYPLFANTTKLAQSKTLSDTGSRPLTAVPPSTARLPGMAPTAREGNVATANVWASASVDPADGSKVTQQLSLGPLGRDVAQKMTVVRKDGSIVVSTWAVFGPLDVYARSAVPPTIFEVPHDLGKECAP